MLLQFVHDVRFLWLHQLFTEETMDVGKLEGGGGGHSISMASLPSGDNDIYYNIQQLSKRISYESPF